jgi:adenine-specific DNA-methyltransferase
MTTRGLTSETELVAAAVALGAAEYGGPLSSGESELIGAATDSPVDAMLVAEQIRSGADPLGDALCRIRSRAERRRIGQFLTDKTIIEPMVNWVAAQAPERVIDAGCGTGRFSMAIASGSPAGLIEAIDADPIATLICRANLAVLDPLVEVCVRNEDFLEAAITEIEGRTAFIGNPPYVRHHALSREVKAHAQLVGESVGQSISGQAGLHALFVLKATQGSKPGDVGSFITSSEWLDAKYGRAVRRALSNGMGLTRLDLIDTRSDVFDDAMSSGVIFSWQVNYDGDIKVRHITNREQICALTGGESIKREAVQNADRWSDLTEPASDTRTGLVQLGSIARVHRGIATGANSFFVMTPDEARERGIEQWTTPCLTRALQVIHADGEIQAGTGTHVLLDLPDELPDDEALATYLAYGESLGVHKRYICSHRSQWWRIGETKIPNIVATYMARRPPCFALNTPGFKTTNNIHGIHLRPDAGIGAGELVHALNAAASSARGRTYYGGLTKIEPREMEAIGIRYQDWDGKSRTQNHLR